MCSPGVTGQTGQVSPHNGQGRGRLALITDCAGRQVLVMGRAGQVGCLNRSSKFRSLKTLTSVSIVPSALFMS